MWLISDDYAHEMAERLKVGLPVTEAARTEFAAMVATNAAATQPPNLTVVDGVAEIKVEGLLTNRPDFFAWLFAIGNTTYQQIQQAISLTESDPSIKRRVYLVNSPGGRLEGLMETLGAMEVAKKPSSVKTSLAASAAYAIAAMGGKIEAVNDATWLGSVGVVRSYFADEQLVEITNTASPKKRPNIKTPEGVAIVQEELDAYFEIFIEQIAEGRGTTVADVRNNFGQGASLVAREAKRRGMIDRIGKPMLRAVTVESEPEAADASAADDVAGETPLAVVAPVQSIPSAAAEKQAAKPKGKKMDPNTLKTEHPDCYAAILKQGREEGETAGIAQGVKQERDRVTAHLIRGKASGAMDLAIESVEKGEEMTETLKAKYDTAGKNAADEATRKQELDAANAAADGAGAAPEAKTKDEQILEIMEQRAGIAPPATAPRS